MNNYDILTDTISSMLAGDKTTEGKRFYGHLVACMKKNFNKDLPAPAGVEVTDKVTLHINIDWFSKFTRKQRREILEHECKHVINYHMDRKDCKDHYMWNLATDAAINVYLPELHDFGITPEKIEKSIGKTVKPNEHAEYYYKLLADFKKDNPNKFKQEFGDGEGQKYVVDTHENWDKSELENNDMSKQTVKNLLNKTIESLENEMSPSNIPKEVLDSLIRLSKSNVSWKSVLRRFVSKANRFSKEASRKKRNRRYGLLYSGKRKKPNLKLAVALDESGSVGDSEFTQFFAELDRIVDNGAILTIMHIDSKINKIYEYKKGMEIIRSGRGGTAYAPAINKAKEMEVDGLIYFGDGEVWSEEVTAPRFPVLWALVRNEERPFPFGSVCKVKVNKE